MNKNLSLDIKLARKKFQIYGVFNILSLFTVILVLLVGFKFTLLAIQNYEKVLPVLTVALIVFGLTDVGYDNEKLYKKIYQTKAFFPMINLKTVKIYNNYKKLFLSFMVSLYILFPVVLIAKNITYFLMAMIVLSLLTLITTVCRTYRPQSSNAVNTGIKFISCALLILWGRNLLPFSVNEVFWEERRLFLLVSFLALTLVNVLLKYPRK